MIKGKFRGFIVFTTVALLLFAATTVVFAHPVPYPPPTQTYAPLPEPDILPSTNEYKVEYQISTTNTFGGMDSNGTSIAVGITGAVPGINFYNGVDWIKIDLDFSPTGIEWSKSNESELFISDNNSDKIFKCENFSNEEEIWTELAGPGTAPGQFNDPHGMYATDSNMLYVVDTGNNRIQLWNGLEWNLVESPQYSEFMVDICIFEDTTYISDNSQNCIYYKTPEETGWNVIINPTYINYPSYMDIDGDGNIYFLSWVIYPEGPRKNIVRLSNGNFSVYVETGSGPGFLNNEPSSEELAMTYYDGLIYCDSSTGEIYRELCGYNSLMELSVNGIPVVPDENGTSYEIILEDSVDECLIEAIPICSDALINGTGTFPLSYGSNEITVTCTSITGLSKQYNVNVIRDISGNAKLSGIFIDGFPLEGFDPDIFIYNNIGCSLEQESMVITGLALNPEANLIGEGTIPMTIGENSVLLTVISQNGINIHNYLLNIVRSDAETEETPSSSPEPSPIASGTPKPDSSPFPIPTDAPDVPLIVDPTSTPPIDRTPTPTPDFRTPNPWQESYDKEMEKEMEKSFDQGNLMQIIIAAIAAIAAAFSVLGYLYYRKKKRKRD